MKKVAVIGLGNIATRHRHNLKLLFPSAELLVMSASGRIPKENIDEFDVIATSVDELIQAKVELVIVASPAPFHALHSIPFIEAGIPTLIEKPVTTSIEDAEAIASAIELYQTPASIGYCLRYLPSAQKLKILLDQGSIGKLYNAHIEIGQYLPDWRPNKDYRTSVSAQEKLGGGALFELSHELDYAQWLLGPLQVKYSILRASDELALDVEDIADIIKRYSYQPREDLIQLFCQLIINEALLNTDDHERNFSMLEDENGWRLSPVYDVVPEEDFYSEHAIAFNGSKFLPKFSDAMNTGKLLGVKKSDCIDAINKIEKALAAWPSLLLQVGIDDERLLGLPKKKEDS